MTDVKGTLMSTVVIVRKGDRVAIAADTLSTSGNTKVNAKYNRRSEKILKFGDTYIGLVGDVANKNVLMSIIVKHKALLSFAGADAIFETFRALHTVLKEQYFINTSEEEHDSYESSQMTLVIANPYGIFELGSWREVLEYERFWAIGSGRDYALGAMFAAYDTDATAEQIAETGVTAGCEFDDGSELPFTLHATTLASKQNQEKKKRRR